MASEPGSSTNSYVIKQKLYQGKRVNIQKCSSETAVALEIDISCKYPPNVNCSNVIK